MRCPSEAKASSYGRHALRDGTYYLVLILYFLFWCASLGLVSVGILWLAFEGISFRALYLSDERRVLLGLAVGTVLGVRVAIWGRGRRLFHTIVAWAAAAGMVASGIAAVLLFMVGEIITVVAAAVATGVGIACLVPVFAALCGLSLAETDRLIARRNGTD